MQVLKLPAIAGLIWVSAGFRLLFQQALRMFSLIVMYFFAWMFVALLATIVGQAFGQQGNTSELVARIVVFGSSVFSPVLLIGYMQACRDIVQGERVSPLYLLRGFQLPRPAFLSLLVLGLIQISAFTLLIAVLPFPDIDLSELAASAANTPMPAIDPHVILMRYLAMTLALVIVMVLWYAPMLAAWHGMRVGKAIFFSIAACWRNKSAFLMFGVGWMIAGSFCAVVMGLVVTVFGMSTVSSALIALIVMVFLGAMYCSVYVTYSSVFVSAGAPAPEAP